MKKFFAIVAAVWLLGPGWSEASVGTEGASFLDIPVGAGPAALGGAYTARATDAYAPVWNPAGLGFLDSDEIAGQHLSYLGNAHYEFLSAAVPLRPGQSVSASLQYLGSGDIAGTDQAGNSIGDFSAYYAASSVAYGQKLGDQFSVGVTGKWIHASLDDVDANAFAMDLGGMYRLMKGLSLAATLTNVGNSLTFLSDGDSLPLATHIGAFYQSDYNVNGSFDIEYERTGLASVHMGAEWQVLPAVAWRMGYHTDTLPGLSALAGFTTGLGIMAWGQEFAYAWMPLGELGNTQYFSLLIRFGEASNPKRNLIQYQPVKGNRPVPGEDQNSEPQNLMELLNEDQPGNKGPAGK